MNIITRKEACQQGFKFYFTGKPCCKGHLSKRYTNNRNCYECKLQNHVIWKQKNIEKYKKTHRKSCKKWIENNREQHRAYVKKYNRDWRSNKDNLIWKNEYQKKYQKNTTIGQLRLSCSNAAHKLGVKGLSYSKNKLLEYSPDEYSEYLLKDLDFDSISKAYASGYHLDHIVPLSFIAKNISSKGLRFKIAMDLRNLRLITADENMSKCDKTNESIVQETMKYLWEKYYVNT